MRRHCSKRLLPTVLLLGIQAIGSEGFQSSRGLKRASPFALSDVHRRRPYDSSTTTSLFLSDVPKEQRNDKDNDDDQVRFKLPPPPEDQIVMAGDLMSLFIYGFADHFVCQDLAASLSASSTDPLESVLDMPPVWLDSTFSYSDHVLQVLQYDLSVTQYSPLLQPMGLAACLLASSWLLSGWWHKAFSLRNTLDCATDRALTVTAKAWFTSCLVLLLAVGFSNYQLSHVVSFTKGDITFVFDTLTVLSMWRFMASSLLGSGRD